MKDQQLSASYQTLVNRTNPKLMTHDDQNPYSSKLILIIDSVPEMQRALTMTLASFGANKVEFATRPGDAMAKLARYSFDIVLCDFDLGNGYDGLHLLEEAKTRNLLKQSCVFMIVSGERRSQRVLAAAELEPDGYLIKPFTGEQLRVRLDRAMRRREAFRCVDDALKQNDLLVAINSCNDHISQGDEFALDFMRLRGSLSLKIGDYLSAKSLYEEVMAIKAQPWAQLGLAKSLTQLKQYDEAKVMFDEVLSKNGRVMEAYDWLAKLYEAQNDMSAAQETLENAVQLSPLAIRRQKELAEVAVQNHDYDTAERALKKTIDVAKYSVYRAVEDYAALARVQIAKGDLQSANQTAGTVRREFRHNAVAEWMATIIDSQVFKKQGQPHRGRELLDEAIKRMPELEEKLSQQAKMELIQACYAQGREDVGNSMVQQIVRNNHDNQHVLERLTRIYEQVDRLEVGKQLIAENVQSVVDINNQAVRLAQSGQLEDAVQMFMQAVEELPQNQQILLNAVNAILAMVHRKGWHETHMAHAYHFLERVRQMDALNGKYQKLQHSYRQVIEQHGKQQWTPVLPKTEEELAAEAAAAEEAAAQAAALKANKGKPVPAPGKTVS